MIHRTWYLFLTFALVACGQRKEPPAPVSFGTENSTPFEDFKTSKSTQNSNTMLVYANPKKRIRPTELEEQIIVVKPQENLDTLADRYQIDRDDIISRNNLIAPYYLFPGQRLKLPKTARARPSMSKKVTSKSKSQLEPVEISDTNSADENIIVSKKKHLLKKGQQRRSTEDREKELSDKFSKLDTDSQVSTTRKTKSAQLIDQKEDTSNDQDDRENIKTPVKKPVLLASKDKGNTSLKENKEDNDLIPIDSEPETKSEKVSETTSATSFALKAPLAGSVKDKIVSDFNQSTGKVKNDGINIKADKNTPILAAQSGQVVYAGNEMQGFGNLILLKHEDGWMTAYGHCAEILVKEKQFVKQGDTIAKVGNTGSVRDSQLHFQLRKKSTVIDPKLYLE